MAFRGDSTDTYTYSSGSTGGTVDLGARNNYRYINATNVYNKGKSDGQTTHTGTYTFAVNDTGGTKDLGTIHSYRYINATNVYNKGKADGLNTKPTINCNYVYTSATQSIPLSGCNNGDVIIIHGQFTEGSYTSTAGLNVKANLTGYNSGGYNQLFLFGNVTNNTKSISYSATYGGWHEIIRFSDLIPSGLEMITNNASATTIPLSSCTNGSYYIITTIRAGMAQIEGLENVANIYSFASGRNNNGYVTQYFLVKVLNKSGSITIYSNYGGGYNIMKLTY